jgi:hypothetical protein
VFFDRQECHANRVSARLGQDEAEFLALTGKELVGNLDQDASAIAGFRIASTGAAMGKVEKDLNPLADDVVTLLAIDAGDEPDTAGIMLVRGVVETLCGRQAIARV